MKPKPPPQPNPVFAGLLWAVLFSLPAWAALILWITLR